MADLVGVNGQRKDFSVVGKPNLPGRLSHAIASGIAKYGIDYVVPDMLHAKFLKSPYANAKGRQRGHRESQGDTRSRRYRHLGG